MGVVQYDDLDNERNIMDGVKRLTGKEGLLRQRIAFLEENLEDIRLLHREILSGSDEGLCTCGLWFDNCKTARLLEGI